MLAPCFTSRRYQGWIGVPPLLNRQVPRGLSMSPTVARAAFTVSEVTLPPAAPIALSSTCAASHEAIA